MTSRLCEPSPPSPPQPPSFPRLSVTNRYYVIPGLTLVAWEKLSARVNISAAAAASLHYHAQQDAGLGGQRAGGGGEEIPRCRGGGVYDIAYRLVSPVLAACLQSWKTGVWYTPLVSPGKVVVVGLVTGRGLQRRTMHHVGEKPQRGLVKRACL